MHDVYRPSYRPYDPKEIKLIKRFNALADEDRHFSSSFPIGFTDRPR